MPQLHLYVSDEIAAKIKERAARREMSVSRYLAEMVRSEVEGGWPADYFDTVIGGWQGDPLIREPQGAPETRLPFE